MRTIGAFVDTSTVNRILDIGEEKRDPRYEEDRSHLSRIVEQYVKTGRVRLIVNPSVQQEIENTSDPQRRKRLLAQFNQFHFTSYNKTIFPFRFPATFVTEEESETMEELRGKIRGFEKDEKIFDEKIFLDALSNSEVEVLLTTDREHLADKGLNEYGILVFTPKQFLEYLQNIA